MYVCTDQIIQEWGQLEQDNCKHKFVNTMAQIVLQFINLIKLIHKTCFTYLTFNSVGDLAAINKLSGILLGEFLILHIIFGCFIPRTSKLFTLLKKTLFRNETFLFFFFRRVTALNFIFCRSCLDVNILITFHRVK